MSPSKINAERLWNCCTQFFDICSPSFQISLCSRFTCRQESDEAQGVNPHICDRFGSAGFCSRGYKLHVLLFQLGCLWLWTWTSSPTNKCLEETPQHCLSITNAKEIHIWFYWVPNHIDFPKKSQNMEAVSLWHQLHQIKRKYCFAKISYKFLFQTMLIFLQNIAGEVFLTMCIEKNPR